MSIERKKHKGNFHTLSRHISLFDWIEQDDDNDDHSFRFSDVYENGSLFIRPFRNYFKSIHAGTFLCQAENAAGSIQTTPIQLKPRECVCVRSSL